MNQGPRAGGNVGVRRRLWGATLTVTAVGVLTGLSLLPLERRQGINDRISSQRVSLATKASGFLLRDAEYRRLAAEITHGCTTDEARAFALLAWTRARIHPTPEGWQVIDDHILNIIIRGYGEEDQQADVFTTLAAYAGLPAFWKIVKARSGDDSVVLSFLRLNGQWTVWDVRRGVVFSNARGQVASLQELRQDGALIAADSGRATHDGQDYRLYVEDGVASVDIPRPLRAHKQMPGRRILFECERLLWKPLRWAGGNGRADSVTSPEMTMTRKTGTAR